MSVGFLDRARIVAPNGWSRWLVPPAALSVHLAIGQVYAWSVFKAPLEKYLHLTGAQSAVPFQLGIVMLGLSAAVLGTRVEKNGPRWAMFTSLMCFCSGLLLAALGAYTEQYWLVVAGYGGLGGIGLGVGYISPVSTLIKWFPDRPGMATGIAIMGFGGGALIASPWSTAMLTAFGVTYNAGKVVSVADDAIAMTFLVHGLVYAVFMTLGVLLVRVPAADWKPQGFNPATVKAKTMVTTAQVSARNAIRTPQFWCLWIVLCFNVTAGIGILEKAAPMIIDFFGKSPMAVTATAAAGFVALLSLANMLGRIVWSSASDIVGRKNIYRLYLGAGAIMYLVIATVGIESKVVFISCAMVILSFYGAGFATIPAYLRDLFGTFQVGAIHGRLLTAWSMAGVLGPLIINQIADQRKAEGFSGPGLYTLSFYIMIGLLVIGFAANELVRPVAAKFHEARALGELGKARPETKSDGKKLEIKKPEPEAGKLEIKGEAKPVVAKAAEAKPSEAKPVEAKAAEAKPPQAKAPEARPPEAKRAESKNGEARRSHGKKRHGKKGKRTGEFKTAEARRTGEIKVAQARRTGEIKTVEAKKTGETKVVEAKQTGETKTVDKSDPEIEIKVVPEAESKSEPKAEIKVVPEAEIKSEPKAETKSEPKAEAEAEPEAELKTAEAK